jgi:hypothetical protein
VVLFAVAVLLAPTGALAGKTYAFNVTNSACANVVAQTTATTITVYENTPAAPTTAFEVHMPLSSDSAIKRGSGDRFTFYAGAGGGGYSKGSIAGCVKLSDVAGPVEFAQIEQ